MKSSFLNSEKKTKPNQSLYILIPFIQNFLIEDYIKRVSLFYLERQSDHIASGQPNTAERQLQSNPLLSQTSGGAHPLWYGWKLAHW